MRTPRIESEHSFAYQQQLPVHILRSKNRDGEHCYFILRTSKARFTQLLAKKNRESVNIADYGEILASGYGSTPSARVVHMLQEKYGIELPESM